MDVNLNWCKYFVAVVEEKSVTKAAIRLGVSQPTVSYNIKELENFLQEKLFEVKQQGVAPVPRAIVLYNGIKSAYYLIVKSFEDFIRQRSAPEF